MDIAETLVLMSHKIITITKLSFMTKLHIYIGTYEARGRLPCLVPLKEPQGIILTLFRTLFTTQNKYVHRSILCTGLMVLPYLDLHVSSEFGPS